MDEQLIYLVDDDPAVLESLSWLMDSAGYPARAFESGSALLAELPETPRGCLVVDLRMPGMSGIDLIGELKQRGVGLPAIMITGHGDVPAAVRAMKTGAVDFIEKPFDQAVLLDRVRGALGVDAKRAESDEQRQQVRELFDRLTPREREVMGRVVRGQLNKQIASDLGISPKTIEVHRSHVMNKMKSKSVAELVRKSVLLESEPS